MPSLQAMASFQMLAQQAHLLHLRKPTRRDPVQIDSARHVSAGAVFTVPTHAVVAGLKRLIHQRADFLSQRVEDLDGDVAGLGQLKLDMGFRVEVIGIIRRNLSSE